MEIKFKCPKCGAKQRASQDLAGEKQACPDCGQWLRVPRPRVAPAAAPRFVDDESEQEPVPTHKPAMSATEVFGFREAPAPPPRRGVNPDEGIFAARPKGGASAAPEEEKLPSRSHYQPMSDAKKKKLVKRSAQRDKARPSYAGAGIGVSFALVLSMTLFAWRIYRAVTRFESVAAGFSVGEEAEPGSPRSNREIAVATDREVHKLMAAPGGGEARDWLDTTKYPKHFVWEMSLNNAREMVKNFYDRGAVKITVVDPTEVFGKIAAAQFAIELPSDAAARKKCIEYYRELLEDDETVDVGQNYLLFTSD